MPQKSNASETDKRALSVPEDQDDELETADDDEDFEDDDEAEDEDNDVDEEDVEEA
jgi:hypothetical protein